MGHQPYMSRTEFGTSESDSAGKSAATLNEKIQQEFFIEMRMGYCINPI